MWRSGLWWGGGERVGVGWIGRIYFIIHVSQNYKEDGIDWGPGGGSTLGGWGD